MGAWIEIGEYSIKDISQIVAPVWGRGLKSHGRIDHYLPQRRPRMGAWIEIRMVIRRGTFAGGWV